MGLFITAGYVMSQLAVWRGEATDFAQRIDQPPIAILAGLLLVLAIAIGLLPREEQE